MLLQSCRHFNDSGECVTFCPPEQIYNPVTYQPEDNPNAKFAYGNTCIEDCRTGEQIASSVLFLIIICRISDATYSLSVM